MLQFDLVKKYGDLVSCGSFLKTCPPSYNKSFAGQSLVPGALADPALLVLAHESLAMPTNPHLSPWSV
jgi:hypothetical protein